MKQQLTHLLLAVLAVMLSASAMAQTVPMGMKYQAVARDARGQVLSNTELQLLINLYVDPVAREIAYTELHKTRTDDLGLFSLSIGEGLPVKGAFVDVPWSEAEVWMQVSIQLDGYADFLTISDSRMLSVPYAFHAATAGELIGQPGGGRGSSTSDPMLSWLVIGNKALKPDAKLGTLDNMDVVVVTNNLERMRVLADGDVAVTNNLGVEGNLGVAGDVELNVGDGETHIYGPLTGHEQAVLEDVLSVYGATKLADDLDVLGQSRFRNETESFDPETGAVVVTGGVGIGGNLNVGGDVNFGGEVDFAGKVHILDDTESTNTTTGALVVDGGVGIGKNLNIGGNTVLEQSLMVKETATFDADVDVNGITTIQNNTQSNTKDDGALVVEGGVGIEGNLNVGGRIGMSGNSAGFIATITNTNDTRGDGLEIRLGKNHPAWDEDGYLNVTNPGVEAFDGAVAQIEDWIEDPDSFQPSDLLNLWPNAYLAGFSCNLFNVLTSSLNDAMDLPLDIGPYHLFGPFQLFGGIEEIGIPPLVVPAIGFPNVTILPEIPQLNCSGMPSLSMPKVSFTDVANSLDNENQFISFKDKDGRELGSIRAESVSDWRRRFFSGEYVVDVMAQVVGIDLLDCFVGAINKFTELASSHNSIGVEYASGHGDYAEWLERANPAELINEGDIVAVMGGKITKDLAVAEQVMVVSTAPIMMGNQPEAGKENLGNKIAFLGQVPVKIIGPVETGDFIVGNPATPGYGVAVDLAHITPEQARYVVGRAWETKPQDGPKRVNAVIGVDNGYFLQLLQQQQQSVQSMDARLASIEARLGMTETAEATASAETVTAPAARKAKAGGKGSK
jgi:hypothetical protein